MAHSCRSLITTDSAQTCARMCRGKRIRREDASCPYTDEHPPCPMYEEWDGTYNAEACEELAVRVAAGLIRGECPAWYAAQHWAVRHFGWDVARILNIRRQATWIR
jgi:hypothetical protein